MAALVGLAFMEPVRTADSLFRVIRGQVGYQAVVSLLFPRYWCIYAITLLISTLVDRSAKAAATMTALAIALVLLALSFQALAPFSGFTYWLPFESGSGALVNAASSPAIWWWTGLSSARLRS